MKIIKDIHGETYNKSENFRIKFDTIEEAQNYRDKVLKDWFQVVICPDYGKRKKVLVSCNFKRVN